MIRALKFIGISCILNNDNNAYIDTASTLNCNGFLQNRTKTSLVYNRYIIRIITATVGLSV